MRLSNREIKIYTETKHTVNYPLCCTFILLLHTSDSAGGRQRPSQSHGLAGRGNMKNKPGI